MCAIGVPSAHTVRAAMPRLRMCHFIYNLLINISQFDYSGARFIDLHHILGDECFERNLFFAFEINEPRNAFGVVKHHHSTQPKHSMHYFNTWCYVDRRESYSNSIAGEKKVNKSKFHSWIYSCTLKGNTRQYRLKVYFEKCTTHSVLWTWESVSINE